MVDSNKPVIKITELEQAGFVVRNVDKSVELLWKNFGIGPWVITTLAADFTEQMTYYGKPARFGFKAACTQNKLGGVEIELIEPIEGDSIYRDFLREHGEGFHHMGWHKVASREAFEETARALEQAGFPCMMSGQGTNVAYGYFDTTKVLNTILEVLWQDFSREAPSPPSYIYP